MSKLILRTVQPIAVLNTINRTSVYHPHSDLIVEPLLLKHYGFMRNALINRTNVTPDDKHWPVWVWFGENCEEEIKAFEAEGRVLLTLEVDASRVLLSLFDIWCNCLNSTYIADTHEEDEAFQALEAQYFGKTGCISKYYPDTIEEYPGFLKDKITATWSKMFDLTYHNDMYCYAKGYPVQGVLWEIRKEDIVSVEYLCQK